MSSSKMSTSDPMDERLLDVFKPFLKQRVDKIWRYNPVGFDFQKLPRCGAKLKSREDETCRQTAMSNGRCYLHGGKSTGPRTQEGLARMKLSKTKHGYYSKEQIASRRSFRKELQQAKNTLQETLGSLESL